LVDEEIFEEEALEDMHLEDELLEEELEEISDPTTFSFKEFYPVNPPFGFIGIQVDEELGKSLYITFEPTLEEDEQNTLEAIREVIAFPKNRSAFCPLTRAPSYTDDLQLEELGLEIDSDVKDEIVKDHGKHFDDLTGYPGKGYESHSDQQHSICEYRGR